MLRDIQEAAIDEQSQVATLLRKCKVLAARLGSEEFSHWIDYELNGYANLDQLPAYRVLHVRSYGDFVGPFGSQMKNAPIPPSALPEVLREGIQTSKVGMPISTLTSLSTDETSSRLSWPPDVVSIYGGRIYEGMNCLIAWQLLPRSALVAILDTVRTRVLNSPLRLRRNTQMLVGLPSARILFQKKRFRRFSILLLPALFKTWRPVATPSNRKLNCIQALPTGHLRSCWTLSQMSPRCRKSETI